MNHRVLGACVVALAMVGGAAQAVSPPSVPAGAAVDPGILAALQAGQNPVDVIVTGPAHIGFDGDRYASRAAGMAALQANAAPFFDLMRRLAAQTGSTVRETWAAGPSLHMLATPAAIDRMGRMREVRGIEHEKPDAVKLIPPLPGADLGPLNTGGREMIQAPDIWALGYRGEGIKLAMIDTGIYGGHEAFKNADGSSRIAAWRDFTNHNYATPSDGNGHGTHTAGTAAGSRLYNDPTYGFFEEEGVAPRATILGVKNLDDGGSGQWAWALSALQWSFDNGADITSNSWGGGCSSEAIAVVALARTLTDLGMLSVFAAGNSGPGPSSIICPGRGESVLTIGAVDQNRNIAGFSSRGPCTDPDTGTPARICPDVVAKGVDVRSAWPRPGSGYNTISGTSMATPHAAGAAVLAEQMKRALTGSGWDTAARAEETLFKSTSEDLGAGGEDNDYGWGLVQLLNIYAVLSNPNEARIIDRFEISLPVVRETDSTTLLFGVRNFGGRVASGPFRATLTDPLGNVTVLRDRNIALGLLDGEQIVHTVTIGSSDPIGVYTFRGTFDYTWTDPDGGIHTGLVDRSGTFLVKRIIMDAVLEGFEDTALPLVPQNIEFTATNNGNEEATGVTISVDVPAEYLFIPGSNFDPAQHRTLYSNPAPDQLSAGGQYRTLTFFVGTLAPDESFSFTSTIAPRAIGAFTITAKVFYRDGAGRQYLKTSSHTQTVP